MGMHLQDWFFQAPWALWLTGVVLACTAELIRSSDPEVAGNRAGWAAAGGCGAGAITASILPALWWAAIAVAAGATYVLWQAIRPRPA